MRSASFRNLAGSGKFHMNKADASDVFCAGLWDTYVEHHRAIGALLAHELPTSALVILRTFIETSYRLIWLRTCASEQEVKRITRFSKKSFPDISRIVSDLVRKSGIHDFSTTLPDLSSLHDSAHFGSQHLSKEFQRVRNRDKIFEQDAFLCICHADRVLFLLSVLFFTKYGNDDQVQALAL